MCFEYRFLFRYVSASLLSEICKGLRQERDKGQHFLDFFSLTRTALLGEWFSPLFFPRITPHSTQHLDVLLGTFGISEKCAIGNTKSPLLL